MSYRSYASMYLQCRRGKHTDPAVAKGHHNRAGGETQFQMGRPDLHCRSAEPPSAAVYQDWLTGQLRAGPRGQHGKTKVTGEKLRRAVRMVRNGYNKTEASRTNGIDHKWIDKLPPELAP